MHTAQEIAEKVKTMAKERDVTVKQLLDFCSLNKNAVFNMQHGSWPSAETLAKIADYLDCSVDHLLGRDIKKEPAAEAGDELLRDIAGYYSELNGEGRRMLFATAQSLALNPLYKKYDQPLAEKAN